MMPWKRHWILETVQAGKPLYTVFTKAEVHHLGDLLCQQTGDVPGVYRLTLEGHQALARQRYALAIADQVDAVYGEVRQ